MSTSGVTEVAAGYQHTCAIVSGALKCWGNNNAGQLGFEVPKALPIDIFNIFDF